MKVAIVSLFVFALVPRSLLAGAESYLDQEDEKRLRASPLWHDRKNDVGKNKPMTSVSSAAATTTANKDNQHRSLSLAISPTVTKSIQPECVQQANSDLPGVELPEELTVSLSVQGAGSTTQLTVPVHVIFALDSSSSMQRTDPDDLRIVASTLFVERLR